MRSEWKETWRRYERRSRRRTRNGPNIATAPNLLRTKNVSCTFLKASKYIFFRIMSSLKLVFYFSKALGDILHDVGAVLSETGAQSVVFAVGVSTSISGSVDMRRVKCSCSSVFLQSNSSPKFRFQSGFTISGTVSADRLAEFAFLILPSMVY